MSAPTKFCTDLHITVEANERNLWFLSYYVVHLAFVCATKTLNSIIKCIWVTELGAAGFIVT